MPRTPKGHKRPADVIGNAVAVMRIATGEIQEGDTHGTGIVKDSAAVALGRKGGHARAAVLTKTRRKKIAREAADARWAKAKK